MCLDDSQGPLATAGWHDGEPAIEIDLEPVDSVTVITLMDNLTDNLMADQGPARRVTLEVGDDGHGFTPEAPSAGVCLASMRERAATAGGALTITSKATGTLVRMTVPVKTPGAGDRCPSAC